MPYQTSIDVNFESENCSNSSTIIDFTNMQRAIQSPSLIKRKAPPPLESSDLNVSLLLRLSIDTLSCVEHRITKEQEELGKEEKLGLFSEIFDSLLHNITDKLLLKNTWCDADYFKDIVHQLVVVEGEVCSRRFWNRWEVTKCIEKGQTGYDRWRKNYSARRNLLLFNRRLFCLVRPPSVLFGCLSSIPRNGELRNLVNAAFLDENKIDDVVASPKFVVPGRSTFSVKATFGEKRFSCFGRMSLGIFFGMKGYDPLDLRRIKTEENPQFPTWFDVLKKIDPVIYSNPFTEMLEVCRLFEERIKKVMKGLKDAEYFEVVQFAPLQLALADPSCAVIQELHYFEMVSLLVGVQLSLQDFLLRHDEVDWPEELAFDKPKLRNLTTYLDECLESFRINVWYSDLHFFFAYFRGKLFSLFFVGSYEVMQTVTLFTMSKGLISTMIYS